MPRARTIKPHFLHSASMRKVNRDAQLTFIRLWLVVDDAGRAIDHPVYLPGKLYPGAPDTQRLVPGWLDELERAQCIVRYGVGADRYLRVVNWRKHQKIYHPTPSRLPAEPTTPDALASRSGTTRESLGQQAVEAAPGNASKAVFPNSETPRAPLGTNGGEAAKGRLLSHLHERFARLF